ncbi:MAG: class I SAM-dependent methyltransferase [Candidatus Thiodiazotropha sp.]
MIDPALILKDYDESTYLELNPDVSAAVENQSFASGLEHCLLYGIYEDRPGLPRSMREHMQSRAHDSISPPDYLRSRVHGDESLQDFENAGKLLSYHIFSFFCSHAEKARDNHVFDFGCGCGRVVRYLSKLFAGNHFYASDIDHEAIAWCRENLSDICEFTANDALPPLPFESKSFDFIYSISVFTHLPEEMQIHWLDELRRVTKRNGYLLLTTHGQQLAPEEVQQGLNEHGFHYAVAGGTDGLPDFYQTSFHTEEYIRRTWGRYLEIVDIVNKGIMNHQDLVICRNSL